MNHEQTYMKWITGVVDSLDAPHAFVIDNAPYHTGAISILFIKINQ